MTVFDLKVVVNLPHTSLIPADTDQLSFVVRTDAADAAAAAAHVDVSGFSPIRDFFLSTPTGLSHPVRYYMANNIAGASTTVEYYDITAHLDGSPHGSPVLVSPWNLGTFGDGGPNLPAECAAVLTLYGAGRPAAAVNGPVSAIPNSPKEIRDGAPATHLGRTRPKQSHTGRMYIGPLDGSAVSPIASEQRLHPDFLDTLGGAAVALSHDLAAMSPTVGWFVWSRKLAITEAVIGGHIDNAPDTQRRRGVKSTARVNFTT